jgi:hypothetical protein
MLRNRVPLGSASPHTQLTVWELSTFVTFMGHESAWIALVLLGFAVRHTPPWLSLWC